MKRKGELTMGGKYEIRWEVKDDIPYRNEYTNSLWKFLGLLIKHRRELIYFTVRR